MLLSLDTRVLLAVLLVIVPLGHRAWLYLKLEKRIRTLERLHVDVERSFPHLKSILRGALGTQWYHISFPAIGAFALLNYFLDWSAGVL